MNLPKEKPTIIKLSANADDAQKYKAQARQLGMSRSDFLLGLIEGQQRYPSFVNSSFVDRTKTEGFKPKPSD